MRDAITVGVVQTSLDYKAAWRGDSADWRDAVRMSRSEERRARREVRHYLAFMRDSDRRPDVILFPELSVPIGFVDQLRRSAEVLEAIVVAGVDYRIEPGPGEPMVSNEAVIVVPRKLGGNRVTRTSETRRIGKTYPSNGERKRLEGFGSIPPIRFKADPTIWVFQSPDIGDFGVAICYDFMDLNRIAMYRGNVQSLFVLSYNRDEASFYHLAEAITRTAFCNVVVCNCGYFGGSVAVSPYRDAYRRTVYRNSGQGLANAQMIELPLQTLKEHQEGSEFYQCPIQESASRVWGPNCPGYETSTDLNIVPSTNARAHLHRRTVTTMWSD